MDVTEAIETRLEVREYADETVDAATREAIVDAGRLAPSGKNLQHWSFVLVDDDADVEELAALSTTGTWVAGADFAVVVLTDPDYHYHELDAGRAITHMQLAAHERGVGSCIYTGYDEDAMREYLGIPDSSAVTAVVGFGYPAGETGGEKSRKPMGRVAFDGRYGEPLAFE